MRLGGIPAVAGIVCGKAMLYAPYDPAGEQWAADQLKSAEDRTAAYEGAKSAALMELAAVQRRLSGGQNDAADVLGAQQTLLEDVAIDEDIRFALTTGACPSQAIINTYNSFMEILRTAESDMIEQRVADLRDVCNRLLRCLAGKREQNLAVLDSPVIVVAKDLYPSDTAAIDRKNILGIVTEEGGLTSHTVVIARGYGIPTVVGVTGVTDSINDGDELIADAEEGCVCIRPSDQERALYRMRKKRFDRAANRLASYLEVDAVTRCGTRVQVELNISGADGMDAEAAYADGVGLMRSEFLYLGRKALPDEQEQMASYRAILEKFSGKPVILRTLDVGGDKQLPCLQPSREQNPFLGKRALRLCLDQMDVFRVQLRAAIRASAYGDLWLMFPMVGSLDDWRRAKSCVYDVMQELEREKIPFNRQIKLGIMIEIPAIALMADKVAREADFASIGSNDLCQYLLAADRMNPEVSPYYQEFHPAVFRLLGDIAQAFSKSGKPLGICGEMGGDPLSALALLGLGIRVFSMSAANVPRMKRMITKVSLSEAKKIADEICGLDTADEVKKVLQKEMDRILSHEEEGMQYARLVQ